MNKTKCKAENCKHNASRPSGLCGWCDRKHQKGLLSPDGRPRDVVCKAHGCKRKAKSKGFCGWCVHKFERGELDSDGSLSFKEAQKQKRKEIAKKKREQRKALQEKQLIKDQLKLKLSLETLKLMQEKHPEYRKTIHCPYYNITICPAACFGRMFVRQNSPSKCKKCDVYNDELLSIKSKVERLVDEKT